MDKGDVSVYYDKGTALYTSGKYPEAIECYDEAIKLDPNYPYAYNHKGYALKNSGKTEEAIKCFDKAIELEPGYSLAYNGKGSALLKSGKYQEAIKCFEKAIEINPRFFQAKENIEAAMTKLDENTETPEEVPNSVNPALGADTVIQGDKIQKGELLGKGASAKVYKGKYALADVAVKEIDLIEETEEDRKTIEEKIAQEVNLMKNLRHTNLVYFYGHCLEKDKILIVMELCKGKSLFELLKIGKVPLSINQKLKILSDIAAGIYYLHTQTPPILHRDIKSLNVLLINEIKNENSNIIAKISDFGLSKTITDNLKSTKTQSQVGTTAWMAPEMFNGLAYGVKSDVYSFGIVMWEVFAQRIPYDDVKIPNSAIGVQVITINLRPTLKLLPKDTPEEVIALMQDCWNADYKLRPTMEKVHEILNKISNK